MIKLKCGCVRGYFLCPEAIRLWGLYSLEHNNKNYKKAEYYRKQYEDHFNYSNEKPQKIGLIRYSNV